VHLFSTLIDLVTVRRLSDRDKTLEILVLRQQLAIAEQKLHKPVRASRVQRFTMALLTFKLKSSGTLTINQLRDVIRVFQLQTVLGWHRQLVKRKWTYNPKGRGGLYGAETRSHPFSPVRIATLASQPGLLCSSF
jgi:hypothetical protein